MPILFIFCPPGFTFQQPQNVPVHDGRSEMGSENQDFLSKDAIWSKRSICVSR